MHCKRIVFLSASFLMLTVGMALPRTCHAATTDDAEAAYAHVKAAVASAAPSQTILAPEGEFITVANPAIAGWVSAKIDRPLLDAIAAALKPSLRIDLNSKGFAPAATRTLDGEKDETNYDAIWVRDNIWVYFSLLADPERSADAKRLLLALWDYYATDAQIKRFAAIIDDPAKAQDPMAMPHIRFNGASSALDDVMVDGKPETWNHRQIDAHGLFFIALGEAIRTGIITADELTEQRFAVIALYPRFLTALPFYDYEDAGAWEEIPRKNSSSIGLATRSLQVWRTLLYREGETATMPFRKKFEGLLAKKTEPDRAAWSAARLDDLIAKGLATVKRQLTLGGESPDYAPDDLRFRRADAALIFLIQPALLDGLSEEELRRALLIVETLKRPAGIIRYEHDSYQAGNYWITPSQATARSDAATLTGDTSSRNAFLRRLSTLIPETEAQWFFDSLLAMARLRLAEITTDQKMRAEDLHYATIHLKRALGQITGGGIAADGKPVKPLQTPESINTVVIDEKRYYLPSPITPLNWAKAGLAMAIARYRDVALRSAE